MDADNPIMSDAAAKGAEPVKKKKSVKKTKPAAEAAPEAPPAAAPAPAPAPAAEPAPANSHSASSGGSTKKRAARTGSNVFAMFTQNQVAEFKEVFSFIDQDKDGFLSKSDIRASFDQVGRLVSDRELEEMLKEATGAINFTQFLQIFGNRVAGMDEEDVIFNAFTVFDDGDGFCSENKLRKMLTTFGERLTDDEAADAFNEAPMDSSGRVDLRRWANLLTRGGVEEQEA